MIHYIKTHLEIFRNFIRWIWFAEYCLWIIWYKYNDEKKYSLHLDIQYMHDKHNHVHVWRYGSNYTYFSLFLLIFIWINVTQILVDLWRTANEQELMLSFAYIRQMHFYESIRCFSRTLIVHFLSLSQICNKFWYNSLVPQSLK